MANARLVYSTDGGDQRRRESPGNGAAVAAVPPVPNDGVVRVYRERSGRGGKTVTVVRGLPGELAAVARELKRLCGSGGAVKGAAVEIQGDHRDRVVAHLRAGGYRVKAAGG